MPEQTHRSGVRFAISHRDLDARTSVVLVEGELDLASAPSLKWELVDLVAAGHSRLIVDLSLVTFMDSTALGALIGAQMTLNPGEMLVIASAPAGIVQLFELTGLDRKLSLFATVGDALAHVREAPFTGAERPVSVERPQVEAQAHPPPGSAPDLDPVSDPTRLTRDAALALGIAATAVPFARSRQAQAERWLRALYRCGGAGIALSSLGVTDIPSSPVPAEEGGEHHDSEGAVDRDAVATVTEHARRLAAGRGDGATIGSADLLGAVIEVYGADLDRLLIAHGTTADAVTELLARTPESYDS